MRNNNFIKIIGLFFFLFTQLLYAENKSDSLKLVSQSKKLIYKFDIKREIGPAIWRQTIQSFKEANKLNADYIIIHMNTYGGLLDAADSVRTAILNSKIPVFVFIDNNAASAGALISIACDSIYMRKGANIGAATVVSQTGEVVADKYQAYMRSMMRSTAEAHGKDTIIQGKDTIIKWFRDPMIAEAMVDPRSYIEGIIDTGKVLTFTTSEAIKYGYCEGDAENIKEVLKLAGIENYEIKEYKLTTLESIIGFLVNPLFQGFLIMIIMAGIYFELQTPGIGFPLAAAIMAALLYFSPLYLEGLAENWEIVLFVLGLILIGLEIFVIPGFGIAGISGILFIVTGLTLSMVGNIVFDFSGINLEVIFKSFFIVTSSMLISFILSLYFSKKLLTSEQFKYLVLRATQKKEKGFIGVESKHKEMIGKTGVASTILRPSGKVEINGDLYDAKAEISYIEKGEKVLVAKFEAGQLYVRRI